MPNQLVRFLVDTEPMSLATVILVEDDALTRASLTTALEFAGFTFAASVSDAASALEASHNSEVEVALLDLDLGPGPTGIDIAVALRKIHPRIGIVFLTSFLDPRLSRAENTALPKGSRYLTKQDLGGLSKVATTLLQAKFQPLTGGAELPKSSNLTDQQIAVLKFVAMGFNNAEIANKLAVSEKAVEHLTTRTAKVLGISREGNLNLRVQLMRHYSQLIGKGLPE